MKPIVSHHHYKKELIDPAIDRVALYERYAADMLIQSEIKDEQRESSIIFELKHQHSTAQFARILARQRALPIDVCTVGALLHDLYASKNGIYKDHARKSADLVSVVLDELGGFTTEEKKQILLIISNHSDKDVWSENPFEEFGKDVDTLDCFLYPNAFGYYLKYKSIPLFYSYVLRAIRIWKELNIPQEKEFSIFDNYNDNWLDKRIELAMNEAEAFVELIRHLSSVENKTSIIPPTLLFKTNEHSVLFYVNTDSYNKLQQVLKTNPAQSDKISVEAKTLIQTSMEAYVLLWAAFDAYEVLYETTDSQRLAELGLHI